MASLKKIVLSCLTSCCLAWLPDAANAQDEQAPLPLTLPQIEYTSLTEIAHNCGLTTTSEPLAGKAKLESPDKEIPIIVVIASGMDMALIDNEPVLLPGKVSLSDTGMRVPLALLKTLQSKIAAKKEAASRRQIQLPPPPKKKQLEKIVIDPGHGGRFPGAAAWGLVESEINLAIALKLKSLLESAQIKVVMTRQTDTNLVEDLSEDLDARVNLANREQPDLFVSIHVNASEERSSNGFEVFVAPVDEDIDRRVAKAVRESPSVKKELQISGSLPTEFLFDFHRLLLEEYYRQSRELASDIADTMAKDLPEPNRDVKEEGFRVIKWTRCPAVLVEVGFITNRQTAQRLSHGNYRATVAEAIAQGILNFKKKFDKTEGFTKSGQDESEKQSNQTGSDEKR
jgi:N-acetylmuramoyl-L-alanine amidase